MKSLLFVFCSLISLESFAQPVLFGDPVTARVFNSEKYSGYRGSPFLSEEWTTGSVVTEQGMYKNLKLRLDAYGNILYFQKDETAFELLDPIRRFYLQPVPGDSSVQIWYTRGLSGNGLKPEQYLQVLEEGKISFYKSVIKQLSEMSEINAGLVKTFSTTTRYYVVKDGSAELVKLASKDIMALFAGKEPQMTTYISERKLSLKKEADVAIAIGYFNGL